MLAARARALREDLEQGRADQDVVRARLAAFGRRLLVSFPGHAGLVEVFARLRARVFAPPPPQDLPRVDAARVLARWPAEDRAARARDLVALPDPAADRQAAWATLELLLRVPGEEARALDLAARLEKRSPPEEAGRLALARFRATRGDWGARLSPLRAHAASGALAEGLRVAASSVLGDSRAHGASWIVPVIEGAALANVALARLRRPALARELERAFDWLNQAGPAPILADAEAADAAGDWARGTTLLVAALERHGLPGDLERALAARRVLLVEDVPRPWRFPLPIPAPPEPPRGEWARRLRAGPDPELLEALGDRARAAEAWLARGEVAHALRLRDAVDEGRLREALAAAVGAAGAELDDELRIDADPNVRALALTRLALCPPGVEREVQALRLAAAGIVAPPALVAPEAAGTISPDDPHHPENRLAAASDLLAAGQLGAAGNVLAALLRKADEQAPARLGVVVAQALEAEEPPAELVQAATRALSLLVSALRDNPTAAYALHEPLLARAQDTSLPDADRLAALEAWLGIWRATETPPDDASLASLVRDEPELVVVAAARLAGSASPVAVMERFLADHPPATTAGQSFSEALAALA